MASGCLQSQTPVVLLYVATSFGLQLVPDCGTQYFVRASFNAVDKSAFAIVGMVASKVPAVVMV